jgi:hypothetical protein
LKILFFNILDQPKKMKKVIFLADKSRKPLELKSGTLYRIKMEF